MGLFDFIDSLWRDAAGSNTGIGDTESVRRIAGLLKGLDHERARFLGAFAYLMARVAHADFDVSKEELATIREVVMRDGGLTVEEAEAVAHLAMQQSVHEGSTEDFLVTREFRRIATYQEKIHLLDCLFALAAAQDSISVVEDNAIRQIASELNLEHEDFIRVRTRYRDQLEIFQTEARHEGSPEGGSGEHA